MIKSTSFPTTIVDGFFDTPDLIRNLALKQEYSYDYNGEWPGKRCNVLDASSILFHTIIQKIILLYFDDMVVDYNANMFFQIIDKKYRSGWIHRDAGNNNIVTGIIYLTPDSKSGTSLYSKKRPLVYDDNTLLDSKKEFYKSINSGNSVNTVADYSQLHNTEYEETVNVKGVYNRLVLFDSNLYHRGHNFNSEDLNQSRLTIVFFINHLNCRSSTLPVPRMSIKIRDNAV